MRLFQAWQSTPNRGLPAALGLAAALLLGTQTVQSQEWQPSQPVEIVVGAGPGGGNDRLARTIQRILEAEGLVDAPLVVQNRPGAGGVVAQEYVNSYEGDGHYILVTNPALITNPITGVGDAEYTDVTPVAQLLSEYVFIFVRDESPIQSGEDLIEALREDPGALAIGIAPGLGTGVHVAFASVARAAGIDSAALRPVPYGTAGDAIAGLLGGHVDVMPTTALNVLPHLEAGTVRVLGVTAPERAGGAFADVPTWRELGYDVVFNNWRGVAGPRNMTPEQLAYWDDVFTQLSQSQEWIEESERSFTEIDHLDSNEAPAFLAEEHENLEAILTELGLAE